MSDDPRQFRTLTRTRLGLIWELAQAGGELDDESAQLAEVMEEHPEYYDVWEQAERFGSEEVATDGVNPFLHVAMHQVVERQLADNDPPETARTLETLLDAGYSRHDAIHAIAGVVAGEIFEILKEDRPFDRQGYVSALQDLVRTLRRDGRRRSSQGGGRRGRRR